ncbi:MAG: asparagine synthase, partial [Desulfobacteraceae bacterium]|nr:asparagine synthase [Desulfobacteraceae bacterium]
HNRMIADVPLGAFLSGGIDSSIVAALMAEHSTSPVKTFSIGFKGARLFDETSEARETADFLKTDHHEFRLNSSDILDVFPDILSTFDEPFSDSSAIPTYIVSRETKKHVTVALSGDGGDELFAGYRSYLSEYWYGKYMLIPETLRGEVIESLFNKLPDSRDTKITEYIRRMKKFIRSTKGDFSKRLLSLKEIFPDVIKQRLLLQNIENNGDLGKSHALAWVQKLLQGYNGDNINRMLYTDLKDSLPCDMLAKVDWMSMKNSLEVRVPFLDHRVVELAFNMPGNLKLYKGQTKYILKETFKDMLPEVVFKRPKAGFEIPISMWLKKDLKFLMDQYLSEKRIKSQGIFDYDVIKELMVKHLTNRTDTSWMLWNLIVFQFWLDDYYT